MRYRYREIRGNRRILPRTSPRTTRRTRKTTDRTPPEGPPPPPPPRTPSASRGPYPWVGSGNMIPTPVRRYRKTDRWCLQLVSSMQRDSDMDNPVRDLALDPGGVLLTGGQPLLGTGPVLEHSESTHSGRAFRAGLHGCRGATGRGCWCSRGGGCRSACTCRRRWS